MSLMERISQDMTAAMRARETARLGALRMAKAALMNREVERGRALEQGEEEQVMIALIKQRRDSIEQFTKGNRPELADKEAREIVILERFQPPSATADDIDAAVAAAMAETGATSAKEFGKVMKAAITHLAGKTADGKAVSETVKRKLG